MDAIEPQAETVDPRIRRTRVMLQEALDKLLKEKDFDKISVQDIADRATLHRATFYDHYPDKFALLECLTASRFLDLLTRRGIKFESCDGALRGLALGVCDYIAGVPGACGGQPKLASHLESAIIAVVRRMILDGLKHHPSGDIDPELVASTVSWAIYGAAREWVHTPNRCPAEQMADTIEKLVSPLFPTPAHESLPLV
jgi:AcrR family transcriptional regulator